MSINPVSIKRFRKKFGTKESVYEIPDLIGMQRESYERFLQMNVFPDKRDDKGIQSVFKSVFPIKDFTGSASLEFVSYDFGEIKHNELECLQRGMTYEISLKIRVRLVVYDVNKENGTQSIRDIKEQEIYFGTIPLMTRRGTFIINGTERAVVSQLHRSSGVFFDHDKGKTHSSGKIVYTARVIPVRGSWIDMEIDPKDILYLRIDRRKKFPVSVLFKAFGYTTEDLLSYFYKQETIRITSGGFIRSFDESRLKGKRASFDILDPESGETVVKKGRLFTKRALRQLEKSGKKELPIGREEIIDKGLASTVINPETGEVLGRAGDLIDDNLLGEFEEFKISSFSILYVDAAYSADSIRKTIAADKVETKEEALMEIYRLLRPGNPGTLEVAQDFLDHLFFGGAYYDLSGVGRMKLNHRLGINTDINLTTLRKEDILLTAKTLVELRDTQGPVDDIDHLGNRRVRAVGELLENQYRIGLVRMERAIKERMSMQEVDALMPHDLVNSKPVSAVVKEFFGTSQLSQFLDQTNPLSETTHKRRLSALGPGGLTRERAGFEVRDVHPSHYGRICPIETPEGPNIGLIVSLCTYARVNDFGFIETPFRVVNDTEVSREIRHLSAFEEKDLPIAQANAKIDETSHLKDPIINARVAGEVELLPREDAQLMDISPNQIVSVSASLIPFLESDDANRALMGSNMQRQAVPLIKSEAPLVGTGVEGVVARDSGVTVVADYDGEVVDVDSSRIVVMHDFDEKGKIPGCSVYNLSKFNRTNQNTCFNHKPIVQKGEKIKKNQIIADGPSTDKGELGLGKNVTVAFMPWGGYNFEDSILVSERLVKDGTFSSVHIEEFEVVARDTKLGKEEITRDIPNIGEEALKNLDESGIIKLGSHVGQGDILVGKVTPKGETQLSPEEKLLRAIFGEKAGDVKDTSLKVPPGVEGIVIDAKVFSRKGVDKDERTRLIEDMEIAVLEKNREDRINVIEISAKKKIEELCAEHECAANLLKNKKIIIKKGDKITSLLLEPLSIESLEGLIVSDDGITERIDSVIELAVEEIGRAKKEFDDQVSHFEKGDDLPPGVIKMIKVYVAMKRVLSVGDKMAGRHGNKGVVSRVLSVEDLPFFEDGTPVDMVLNPLGVPSRMNVGQIMEIHLGRAARALGYQVEELLEQKRADLLREKFEKIFGDNEKHMAQLKAYEDDDIMDLANEFKNGVHTATPVFDGAKESEIKELLKEGGASGTGQEILYDGRTGLPFEGPITVGSMYMLKLHHLVDDKLHARSIGPYSLVTQQPLGGKAQFGGQRLGEMEVWAMEAYGAAYALQEFLTVKSDDMAGRTRMYEKIVKGQNMLEPGLPESFNVLIKELQSLGLDINLIERDN
ncbi:MAG: DNA-directed RNA polymerase subunit beta [Deltaproteobacteria bacterium]|nr:MAG: DNA-directed RNA polymerase subunit beta [Deltaproteobacteria bacterium]PIE75293.1 MAG: DNA-directed RNA polymerase subunit beta [Deltaproteobacteria bacterium]